MSTFDIHRQHDLGLTAARALATGWADAARDKHQMECSLSERPDSSRVVFSRPGVRGELQATATTFDLSVTLGFLLAAFGPRIRTEIERNVDDSLAKASAAVAATGGSCDGAVGNGSA
jgi:putative polyhydroxyalkanoate system protein